jgi:hypothetical protein
MRPLQFRWRNTEPAKLLDPATRDPFFQLDKIDIDKLLTPCPIRPEPLVSIRGGFAMPPIDAERAPARSGLFFRQSLTAPRSEADAGPGARPPGVEGFGRRQSRLPGHAEAPAFQPGLCAAYAALPPAEPFPPPQKIPKGRTGALPGRPHSKSSLGLFFWGRVTEA